MAREISVRVECDPACQAEARPRRFTLGRRSVAVDEIIDRWYGPDYRYVKLRGSDGAMYILRHAETAGSWELTMFDARGCG